MTIIKKIKWVLGILMVFVLILATNLIDRDNFRRINDSVVAIYEDRLVAKDLVFELYRSIQEKETALISGNSNFFAGRNEVVNDQIKGLIDRYLETKLTDNEAIIFKELQLNLETLKKLENSVASTSADQHQAIMDQIAAVKENLYELSKIQLEEGRRQVFISERALATVELFTQLEIYFLIVLAVLIQIIVIYKPKKEAD